LISEGIKRNGSNLGIVRDHHSHWTEKSLEVIRKFSTTSITGVHGNESAESRLHLDNRFLEVKLFNSVSLCTEQLL
jgi:hypothetical protein